MKRNAITGFMIGLMAISLIGCGKEDVAREKDIDVAIEAEDVSLPDWGTGYKEWLLSTPEIKGFDLNDFDGDGVPELLVLNDNEDFSLYRWDGSTTYICEYRGKESESDIDKDKEIQEIIYAYGSTMDSIVRYEKSTYNMNGQTFEATPYEVMQFIDGNFDRYCDISPMFSFNTDGSVDFDKYVQNFEGKQNEISIEEGEAFIKRIAAGYNEIVYASIDEASITNRINDYIKSGNRPRANQWDFVLNADDAGTGISGSIELTAGEKESLTLLAQFSAATRWGDNLAGYSIVPDEEMVSNFVGRLSNENFSYNEKNYDKYLPAQVDVNGNEMAYTLDTMKDYGQNVFGVDISTPSENFFYQEDGAYIPEEFQYPSYDSCFIKGIEAQGEDIYLVKGVDSFIEWDESLMDLNKLQSYAFWMTVKKNSDSPFGYTFVKMEFEVADTRDLVAPSIAEVLLHPSLYREFYRDDTNMNTLYFATADINGDGKDEVLIADKWLAESPDRIINILGMDGDMVIDLDGNKVYQRLQEWTLLDTGIIYTEMGVGENQTHYYNLNTHEEWEAWTLRNPIKFTMTPEGNTLEGDAAKDLNKKLTSGSPIKLKWMEVTEQNIRGTFGQ